MLKKEMELFLSGGGLYVIQFLGALVDIDCAFATFTGTSAGGLLAFLLALGRGVADIVRLLLERDLPRHFQEHSSLGRLLAGQSLVETGFLEALITDLLLEHNLPSRCTMGHFQRRTGKRLRLIAANETRGTIVVLGGDDYLEAPVVSCLLASAAIPVIFPSIQIGHERFFDAGAVHNAALHLAESPEHCTAFIFQPQVRVGTGRPLYQQSLLLSRLKLELLQAWSARAFYGRVRRLVAFRRPEHQDVGLLRITPRGALTELCRGLLTWRLLQQRDEVLACLVLAVALL